MEKSSAEIGQEIADKEQEINQSSSNRDKVKYAINRRRRWIHVLQIKIKELEDSLIKSECIVREKKTEHSILKDAFWRAKDAGL